MDGGSMVHGGMDRDVSGSVDSSHLLLTSIGVVHILRGSMRLAGNSGMGSAMSLVDSMADGRGIAVFHNLMAGLVSQGNSQKARDGDEGLKIGQKESTMLKTCQRFEVFCTKSL